MNREDFLMLNEKIVYFDSGATTLKPKILSEATSNYYNHYSANAHRGDYDISLRVDKEYEHTRKLVKELLNAKDTKEIVFTSGATDSLNKIIFGYFKYILNEGDEILLTKSEHASNILPWFELASELGLIIKYIDLTDNEVKIDNINITDKTKVISLAHVTNVLGDIRPIKEITKLAHEKGIYVLVDGSQSVPHMKVDVEDLDIDYKDMSDEDFDDEYGDVISEYIYDTGVPESFCPVCAKLKEYEQDAEWQKYKELQEKFNGVCF